MAAMRLEQERERDVETTNERVRGTGGRVSLNYQRHY